MIAKWRFGIGILQKVFVIYFELSQQAQIGQEFLTGWFDSLRCHWKYTEQLSALLSRRSFVALPQLLHFYS